MKLYETSPYKKLFSVPCRQVGSSRVDGGVEGLDVGDVHGARVQVLGLHLLEKVFHAVLEVQSATGKLHVLWCMVKKIIIEQEVIILN